MKKLNILIVAALTAVSGSAMAMGFTVEQGKNFTNLNMEMDHGLPCSLPQVWGLD